MDEGRINILLRPAEEEICTPLVIPAKAHCCPGKFFHENNLG
jgi:hypothetical protein